MTFLFRQLSTFAGVGFVATAVHYVILVAAVEIAAWSAVAAALAGFCAGGAVSYWLNRRHTFKSKRPHKDAVWRFALVASGGFALTYILMTLMAEVGRIPYLRAQVATTGVVMLWSFAAHRKFTFARP
jgi:putative flippase GtrA